MAAATEMLEIEKYKLSEIPRILIRCYAEGLLGIMPQALA
jgi:hypothetical protein